MAEWSVPGYTALRQLGAGGFGEVLLARHDATGTLVAIKYLHHSLLADRGFADMFRRIEGKGFTGHYMNAFGSLDDMLKGRDELARMAASAGIV